jgi:hypothetical protein
MTDLMRFVLLSFLCCLLAGSGSAQTSVDSTFRLIDSLYNAGSYSLAELEARRLQENDLVNDSLHTAAEQWIAFSLVAQERIAQAKEHFVAILRRHPSHELDPILTSPKIRAVFNDARATILAARAQESDTLSAPAVKGRGGITFRTIVFPGWEQWYQGRPIVGPLFAGAGAATLGSAITLAFLRKSAHNKYLSATTRVDIEARYDTYNRYARAENFFFAAFAAVYLLSEIDVFLHTSAVTISPDNDLPPAAGASLRLSLPF